MIEVPFIDLKRTVLKIKEETLKDWQDCLDSCWFVGGPFVKKLESSLVQSLRVDHSLCCSNGTDALMVALQAVGIKAGHKVALPNLTFWATYEAIELLGAKPVIVEVDPKDWHLSLKHLREAHDQYSLDGVVLPHLFGWTSYDLNEIRSYCSNIEVPLVEDSAQAFGVEVHGRPVFSDSTISTISFYPSKVIGGPADGGAITTNSRELLETCKVLCNHGRKDHYSYSHVGWNSRMSDTTASYILRAHDLFEEMTAWRNQALNWYQELFAEKNLEKYLTLVRPPSHIKTNGYLCTTLLHEPIGKQIQEKMFQKGVGTARTYPETIAQQKPAESSLKLGSYANSTDFCKRVLNLPLFYGIREEECVQVVKTLSQILKEN